MRSLIAALALTAPAAEPSTPDVPVAPIAFTAPSPPAQLAWRAPRPAFALPELAMPAPEDHLVRRYPSALGWHIVGGVGAGVMLSTSAPAPPCCPASSVSACSAGAPRPPR